MSHGERLTRVQLVGAALLLLLCAALLVRALYFDPAVPWLGRGMGAPWITLPLPPSTDAIGIDRARLPAYRFSRSFRVLRPGPAKLELRALTRFELELDGRALGASAPEVSWKQSGTLELGELQPGAHRLSVTVSNPRGPPALQARLTLSGGDRIESDGRWTVSLPGSRERLPVAPASDSRLYAPGFALPTPLQLLAQEAPVLLGWLLLFSALAWLAGRWCPPSAWAWLPECALAFATLFWLLLYAGPFARLPVLMGFDIPAHLLYIDHLLEQGRLPLATEGWSSYHPPLYHLLTALHVALWDVGREGSGAALVYRSVGTLAGLSVAWSSYLLARLGSPDRPVRNALAVAIAALLPMNVYMAAYVSNEALHGALVGAAVLASAWALRAGPGAWRPVLLLGGALGAAALTKYTALLVAPVLIFFVALGTCFAPGREGGWRRATARAAVVTALVGAIAGWFYARNWWHFGDPLIWNLDLPGSLGWWMQPGFHTGDYYLRFGEVLRHPFFAGFHSFWDGVYSTFWGDGLVAGMIRLETRHGQWSWGAMTLAYLWALPATALLAVGMLRTLVRAFRADEPIQRIVSTLLVTVVFVFGFALLYVTLQLPFYAQSKAFYALGAAVPLAVVGADGLEAPLRVLEGEHLRPLRALYLGYLGSLAALLATAFLGL